MYHHFQSQFLIVSLHSHGFCYSYEEVRKFEHCASMAEHGNPQPNKSLISCNMQLKMLAITSDPLMAKIPFMVWASLMLSFQGLQSNQRSNEHMCQKMTLLQLRTSTFKASHQTQTFDHQFFSSA